MSWAKNNTIFIKNSNDDVLNGCKIFSPYKGKGIVQRILREICFRVPFLPSKIWFNKQVLEATPQYIIIRDPLITVEYLEWLHKKLPKAQLNFNYANMIGKARHLHPNQIPNFVRIWTYDEYDARKYNLPLYPYMIDTSLLNKKKEPEYDVFFVGRDKGRGEWLLDLEKKLQSMGLKTKFIITKNGRIGKNKSYYQKEISYQEVLDFDSKSRAILNVVMENQEGITLRDIEATELNVKLITTNKHFVEKDLYNPNNVFILGMRDINEIVEFVRTKPDRIPEELIEKHTFEHRMDVITQDDYPIHGKGNGHE